MKTKKPFEDFKWPILFLQSNNPEARFQVYLINLRVLELLAVFNSNVYNPF